MKTRGDIGVEGAPVGDLRVASGRRRRRHGRCRRQRREVLQVGEARQRQAPGGVEGSQIATVARFQELLRGYLPGRVGGEQQIGVEIRQRRGEALVQAQLVVGEDADAPRIGRARCHLLGDVGSDAALEGGVEVVARDAVDRRCGNARYGGRIRCQVEPHRVGDRVGEQIGPAEGADGVEAEVAQASEGSGRPARLAAVQGEDVVRVRRRTERRRKVAGGSQMIDTDGEETVTVRSDQPPDAVDLLDPEAAGGGGADAAPPAPRIVAGIGLGGRRGGRGQDEENGEKPASHPYSLPRRRKFVKTKSRRLPRRSGVLNPEGHHRYGIAASLLMASSILVSTLGTHAAFPYLWAEQMFMTAKDRGMRSFAACRLYSATNLTMPPATRSTLGSTVFVPAFAARPATPACRPAPGRFGQRC